MIGEGLFEYLPLRTLTPKTLGVMVVPPRKASKHGGISKACLLQPKSTLFFIKSNGVPVNKMDFPLFQSGTLDEVSLGFVNTGENFTGKRGVLHGMGRNTVKEGFNKSESTLHIQVLYFPTS